MKSSKLILPRNPNQDLAQNMLFRPMKGVSIEDFSRLRYPLLACPKLDGIRCITRKPLIIRDLFSDKSLDILTYALKDVPNAFVRRTLREYNLANLDGELIIHDDQDRMIPYNPVQSGIMTSGGEPNFYYYVFDIIDYAPYWERQEALRAADITKFPRIKRVDCVAIPDADHLAAYEEACIQLGYEGVIVRSIDGPYKCGRSSMKEGFMYKIKRFVDAEATVIGFQELERNHNEPTLNEHGLQTRSDHKAGRVRAGTLGALVCSGHNGQQFNIGSGFTDAERLDIWNNQDRYKLGLVKYKYQKHSMKDAPRSPIFLGWRSNIDL